MMNTHSRLHRLRGWLGLERNILVMLGALLILGMGEELWSRYVPVYLEWLGAGAAGIAAYGALKELLDAIYQYPGGWLADRLGRQLALVMFTLLAIIGYIIYLVSPSWEWVLAGTLFVMAWSSLSLPALFAIIGDNLPPSKRALGFGVQSILKRVPMVLAPPLGGLFLAWLGVGGGIRLGLAITIGLAMLSIGFVLRFYIEKAPTVHDSSQPIDVWRAMDGRLKRLLAADCLARWAEGIPKVFIIVYFLDVLKGEPASFGVLTSVQMLTATLLYLPVAKLSEGLNRKPFVLLTFAFFALFPLILVSATNTFLVVLAFVFAGMREIGEPARKALIVDLASASARGRAVGVYYLVRGLSVFPAPLVGGWLWSIDPALPFQAAFVIGLLGLGFHALWGPGEAMPEKEREES